MKTIWRAETLIPDMSDEDKVDRIEDIQSEGWKVAFIDGGTIWFTKEESEEPTIFNTVVGCKRQIYAVGTGPFIKQFACDECDGNPFATSCKCDPTIPGCGYIVSSNQRTICHIIYTYKDINGDCVNVRIEGEIDPSTIEVKRPELLKNILLNFSIRVNNVELQHDVRED